MLKCNKGKAMQNIDFSDDIKLDLGHETYVLL